MEFVQGCATGAASIAAVLDVRSRRIPNWLTLGTCAAGLLINAWLHGAGGLLGALAGAALGAAALLPFYVVHAMGAGDVKLLAAVGALLGPKLLVNVAIYAALAGGVLSLAIMLMSGQLRLAANEVLAKRRAPKPSGATAPYGVAIATGVYLSLMLPGVLG